MAALILNTRQHAYETNRLKVPYYTNLLEE